VLTVVSMILCCRRRLSDYGIRFVLQVTFLGAQSLSDGWDRTLRVHPPFAEVSQSSLKDKELSPFNRRVTGWSLATCSCQRSTTRQELSECRLTRQIRME